MVKAKYTNLHDVPLVLALWLAHNEYDYVPGENYISATGLMRPVKHIVLPPQIPEDLRETPDVTSLVNSSLGTALHSAVEKAWNSDSVPLLLQHLGYSEEDAHRVLVNPSEEALEEAEDPIVVYLEQRAIREIGGYRLGGKFDIVADGILHDIKSTSVWAWVHGTRDKDYILQGSIYRWLHPDKITEDYIRIAFIFKDWKAGEAESNPEYPQQAVLAKDLPLMSYEDTEKWILDKLAEIDKYKGKPEEEVPECTEEELWLSPPKFKYYANASNTSGRSTKNFDNPIEADAFLRERGKGVVIPEQRVAKRCGYCPAAPICKQRLKYKTDLSD